MAQTALNVASAKDSDTMAQRRQLAAQIKETFGEDWSPLAINIEQATHRLNEAWRDDPCAQNHRFGIECNPDEYARLKALAKRYNLPEELVQPYYKHDEEPPQPTKLRGWLAPEPGYVETRHNDSQWVAVAVVLLVLAIIVRALIQKKPWRSRRVKFAVVFTGLWIAAVQLWGFIWRWDAAFSEAEFFVLNISAPILFALAWLGFNWIRKPQG